MISQVDIPPRTACQPRLHWLISRDWLVGFDPISSTLFTSRVFSHTSRTRQTFAMRAQFNELFACRPHKKAILSLHQVGVPSKHAQDEDEKPLNSNNSTKRNINGRIRAICMQDSGPPGYNHNKFQTKIGCSKKNDTIIWRTKTGTTRA